MKDGIPRPDWRFLVILQCTFQKQHSNDNSLSTLVHVQLVPTLCSDGVDLLSKMLVFDPAKRITAREAMAHPYFCRM